MAIVVGGFSLRADDDTEKRTARSSEDLEAKQQSQKCFSLCYYLFFFSSLSVGDNEGHENLTNFRPKGDRKRISLGKKGTNGGVPGRHVSALFSDVVGVPCMHADWMGGLARETPFIFFFLWTVILATNESRKTRPTPHACAK